MSHIAKLFKNGHRQAAHLSAELRLGAKEVSIRRNPATGDVIRSPRPAAWNGFFTALEQADVPPGVLATRARSQEEGQGRDLFC